MRHLDLFSGIGGFALAAGWAGFETVQFVEIEDYPQRVLRKNFPGVPIHGDIRTYDATHLRGSVSLVTGGFPCQDISGANSRAAGIGGERSGLVAHALRVLEECRPDYAVFENSPNLRIRGGDWLLDRLGSIGYRASGFLVEAADLGANHPRERAFVVAHSDAVGSDAPREPWSARQVAQDERRIGAAGQCGRVDLILRPGTEPRFRVRHYGQEVAGPCFCGGVDGIPAGVDRVKALGNAIVPQVAYPFLAAIADQVQATCPRSETVER